MLVLGPPITIRLERSSFSFFRSTSSLTGNVLRKLHELPEREAELDRVVSVATLGAVRTVDFRRPDDHPTGELAAHDELAEEALERGRPRAGGQRGEQLALHVELDGVTVRSEGVEVSPSSPDLPPPRASPGLPSRDGACGSRRSGGTSRVTSRSPKDTWAPWRAATVWCCPRPLNAGLEVARVVRGEHPLGPEGRRVGVVPGASSLPFSPASRATIIK